MGPAECEGGTGAPACAAMTYSQEAWQSAWGMTVLSFGDYRPEIVALGRKFPGGRTC